MMSRAYHRIAAVKGGKVFYREAGDPRAVTILLLHGLPTSRPRASSSRTPTRIWKAWGMRPGKC